MSILAPILKRHFHLKAVVFSVQVQYRHKYNSHSLNGAHRTVAGTHGSSSLPLVVDKDAVAVDGRNVEAVLLDNMGDFVGDQGESDTVNEEHGLVVAFSVGSGEDGGGKGVHDDDKNWTTMGLARVPTRDL